MLQLTSAIVGMLGGPALQVLVILSIEKQPRSLGFLTDMTDMSDKTLHKAVRKLTTLGYIVETKNHFFQIVDGFKQLPLMSEELPEEVTPAEDVIDLQANEEEAEDEADASRKISDLDPHACMHDSESESLNLENEEEHACMHDEDRNISELDKELKGFREPGLSRLREKPGLTARVVRYHKMTAPGPGAALYRIEHDWRVPDNFEPTRKSYTDDKYADYIQH